MIETTELHDGVGYLLYRPVQHWRVEDLIAALAALLPICQQRGAKRLLVDLRQLTHEPVDAFGRFDFGASTASFWDRSIRICLVARADQIDEERFGTLVARNRGLVTNIFASEAEALAWLLATPDL